MLTVTDACSVTEQAELGLRHYIHRVAVELGLDPAATYCELAEFASAYVALDDKLPDKPHRDLALVWDEHQGWALAIESSCGEDLRLLSWYGAELVPDPPRVAHFLKTALGDEQRVPEPPAWQRRHHGDLHALLTNHAPVR